MGLQTVSVASHLFCQYTSVLSFQSRLQLSCNSNSTPMYQHYRVKSGRDSGSWYHPHFLRGRPDEVRQNFIRTRIKGNKKGDTRKDVQKQKEEDPNFYEMKPIVPEAEKVPMMISSSSKKNFHIADTSLPMVSSSTAHCDSTSATMNVIDLCNDTDFEDDDAPPAATSLSVSVAFARHRRLAASSPDDACGSWQKQFAGVTVGMMFDLPPLPFTDFGNVSTNNAPNIKASTNKQRGLFVKRDTDTVDAASYSRGNFPRLLSNWVVQVQAQPQHFQVQEHDFFGDHEDDEFCTFIRMNIHDPFES